MHAQIHVLKFARCLIWTQLWSVKADHINIHLGQIQCYGFKISTHLLGGVGLDRVLGAGGWLQVPVVVVTDHFILYDGEQILLGSVGRFTSVAFLPQNGWLRNRLKNQDLVFSFFFQFHKLKGIFQFNILVHNFTAILYTRFLLYQNLDVIFYSQTLYPIVHKFITSIYFCTVCAAWLSAVYTAYRILWPWVYMSSKSLPVTSKTK